MKKSHNETLCLEFSQRLKYMLLQHGFSSGHAKTGVRIKELTQATGCSMQMAHRFVNGYTMPDYECLKRIADWLEVSVGWLLYGEALPPSSKQSIKLLNAELVDYILRKVIPVFVPKDSQELLEFIKDLLNRATEIKADRELIMQYIDIAVDSAKRFQKDGVG